MATTWYAQSAAAFDAANQWNDAANGSGSFGTPGNGDTIDWNGKAVTDSGATTRPASGSFAKIRNTASGGSLTVTLSGTNTYTLNSSTWDGSTAGTTTQISTTGAASGASFVFNCGTITGPTTASQMFSAGSTGSHTFNASGGNFTMGVGGAFGLVSTTGPITYNSSGGSATAGGGSNSCPFASGAGLFTINTSGGNITGGSGSNAHGMTINGNGSIVANMGGGSVTGGSVTTAYGAGSRNTASQTITINNANLIDTTASSAVVGSIRYVPVVGNYRRFITTAGAAVDVYYPLRHGILQGSMGVIS